MDYVVHKISSLKDIERVAEIIDVSLSEDFPYKEETVLAYRKNIFNKDYFKDFLKNKENIILGAFKDNNLVGFVSLKPEYGGVLYIDVLVVEKNHRGKGLGCLLLEQAEKWALENKFHYLYLFTEAEKNKAFYTKRGFRYVGTHNKFWFGEDEHIFAKILKDKPFSEVFKKSSNH